MARIPVNVKSSAEVQNDTEREFDPELHSLSSTVSPREQPAGNPANAVETGGAEASTHNPVVPAATDENAHDNNNDPAVAPSDHPRDGDVVVHDGNRIMNSNEEFAGIGGKDTPGGEYTQPQDVDQALEENIRQRTEDGEMQQRQMEGEVEIQTHDLKPHPAHPETGLPENPTDSENSGGANESGDAGEASTHNASTQNIEADERFLRAVADLENYKRQAERRINEARERAARNVIEDLLPVLDNFERALEAAQTASDMNSLKIGIEFIAQQFRDALKNHGVEEIPATGQTFDPLRHEAIEQVPSDAPEGTVVSEAQRGYLYRGQVLRPSRVKVSG
jgi:molecular chaperone GrpE